MILIYREKYVIYWCIMVMIVINCLYFGFEVYCIKVLYILYYKNFVFFIYNLYLL